MLVNGNRVPRVVANVYFKVLSVQETKRGHQIVLFLDQLSQGMVVVRPYEKRAWIEGGYTCVEGGQMPNMYYVNWAWNRLVSRVDQQGKATMVTFGDERKIVSMCSRSEGHKARVIFHGKWMTTVSKNGSIVEGRY